MSISLPHYPSCRDVLAAVVDEHRKEVDQITDYVQGRTY